MTGDEFFYTFNLLKNSCDFEVNLLKSTSALQIVTFRSLFLKTKF